MREPAAIREIGGSWSATEFDCVGVFCYTFPNLKPEFDRQKREEGERFGG